MTKNRKYQRQRYNLERIQEDLVNHQTPTDDEPSKRKLPDSEKGRQSLVEYKIQQAMRAGQFDNLPNAGKPFDFE
ncbi:MAG: DnaJ family domain-containing protein, partial [Pseudomonadota bacterium]